MNHVILIGRVGKDPEIRNIGADAKVANVSLATSRTYKKQNGEKVEDTQWHNLKAWNGIAGVLEKYVKKGDKICITGQIEYRSYEENGERKYITEITVENLEMLGSPRSSNNAETHQHTQPAEEQVPDWLK